MQASRRLVSDLQPCNLTCNLTCNLEMKDCGIGKPYLQPCNIFCHDANYFLFFFFLYRGCEVAWLQVCTLGLDKTTCNLFWQVAWLQVDRLKATQHARRRTSNEHPR